MDSGLLAIDQDQAFPGVGQSDMLVRGLIIHDSGEKFFFLGRGHADAGVDHVKIEKILLLIDFDLDQAFFAGGCDSVVYFRKARQCG